MDPTVIEQEREQLAARVAEARDDVTACPGDAPAWARLAFDVALTVAQDRLDAFDARTATERADEVSA